LAALLAAGCGRNDAGSGNVYVAGKGDGVTVNSYCVLMKYVSRETAL